jgi:hypothetical protein
MLRVRDLEPGNRGERLDMIREVRWLETPHIDGVSVSVHTERFPDGLHFGRRGRLKVAYDDS